MTGAPPVQRVRPVLAVGFGISLLLHALVLLPWLLLGRASAPPRPPPPPREQLVVDLLGLVGNRQVEQQQAGRPAPEPEPHPQPQPQPERQAAVKPVPAPRQPVRKELRERAPEPPRAAPSPVSVPAQPAEPAPPAAAVAAAPQPLGAEEDRARQTVRARETDASVLRQYLASLRKAVQSRLVYPSEAREAGHVGAPAIRFTLTESGDILPGSLAVQRSSGHAALDESALRAAQSSVPFEKPPRQMNVVIAVAFAKESN